MSFEEAVSSVSKTTQIMGPFDLEIGLEALQ
jgi:hypothetical protein